MPKKPRFMPDLSKVKLPPGMWLDYPMDILNTDEDVAELKKMTEAAKAKRLARERANSPKK